MSVPENIFDQLLQAAQEGAAMPSLAAYKPGQVVKTPEEIRRDWLMLRRGKFTASEFHRLMGYQDKPEFPKGGKTYATEKALEIITDWEPDAFVSKDMQWGIDHEAEAVSLFQKRTGFKVVSAGSSQVFLQMGPDVGGTPDGLIPELGSGIEVKCPKSSTHFEYLGIIDTESLKAIAPNYYWQCQGLMEINNSDFWFFVSFDPRFRNKKIEINIAKIWRNDSDIDALRSRIGMAIDYRNFIINRYK